VATNLDRRILVEAAVTESVEINCAVMGNGENIRASVLEQPVTWDQFLTYEEKYMRGGEGMKSAERIIPAPISAELTEQVKKIAIQAFRAIDGRGTARIDFLVKLDKNEIYLNELNTMPGSLAFYLWQEDGLSPRDIVHQLVELARDAHAEKRRSTYNYQTGLIELTNKRGGLKGMKGKMQTPTQSKPAN
jgi:D-alanine-D-alanine ligase